MLSNEVVEEVEAKDVFILVVYKLAGWRVPAWPKLGNSNV